MPALAINYWAVPVAAVACVFLGALWFSPVMFGKGWMAGIGKTPEQVQKDFSPMKIVGAFVGSLVSAAVLSVILGWAQAQTLAMGALVGLMVGIGLLTTTNGVNYLMEGRPAKLFLINNAYELVSMVIVGAILGFWR